jgi:DNA polymerase-3 subunit delta
MTIESVISDLKAKKYSPVYFFCGEEPYYIDQLTKYIEENVLSPDEKEFNQTVLYGLETTVEEIVLTARRFPMMSEYQVVIVKEAQLLKKMEDLEHYLLKPQASTILVIAMKGKEPDKRKNFGKEIAKKSIYLKTERIKDEKIPEWVGNYLRKKGYSITVRAAIMLGEFVGNDLEKVVNEAEKLIINIPKNQEIKEQDVELMVGISKEYNIFEFQKALGNKNIYKANQIAFYFADNPKNNPIPVLIASLYVYFSKLLQFQYLKNQGSKEVAKDMGINPYFIKDYETAARNYNPAKLIRIMHTLRDCDLRSKGVNSDGADHAELIKELTFKLIH